VRPILPKAKENKNTNSSLEHDKPALVRPGAFVFCERDSGIVRFQVEATPAGTLPVEQAASLLAMHCLVRRQTPHDYTMLVVPLDAMVETVGHRAVQLLEAGRSIPTGITLTSRENEVLGWLLRNLSNKQIATQLNVAERTVKFHVSALLAKHKVSDRFTLIRRAMIGALPEGETTPGTVIELPRQPSQRQPKQAKSGRASAFDVGMLRGASTA
jgi:DNA-binding CsgD family transcriptional regulator